MGSRGKDMERRNGVALWRQIADQIRTRHRQRRCSTNAQLPPETRAGAALRRQPPHGARARSPRWCRKACCAPSRAAAPSSQQRKRLRLSDRRRARAFRRARRARRASGAALLLGHAVRGRPASRYGRGAGARGRRDACSGWKRCSEADGRPLSRATSYFDASALRRASSRPIAATRLDHRFVQELRHRRLSPALDADLGAPCRCRRPRRSQAVAGRDRAGDRRRQRRSGRVPVQFSETRFAASRIEFSISSQA